jgi:hypothetical protein
MTVGVGIMAAVLAALVAGIVAFARYSRSPAWRTSEVRMATMRFLVIIGPFFGARVDMPDPTPTSISTPGPDPPPRPVAGGPPPAEPSPDAEPGR